MQWLLVALVLFAQCAWATHVSYRNVSSINNKYNKEIPTNILNLNVYYKNHIGVVDVSLEKPINSSRMIWDISELYLYSFMPDYSIAAGRKLINWSALDQHWELGLINNRKKFSYVDMGQTGLTGIEIEKNFNSGFYASTFISYVYFPEDPRCRVKNKQVVCDTIWAVAPPQKVSVFNKEMPVNYDMNRSYDTFMPTAGFNIGHKNKDSNFNIFYIYKPEAQSRMNINFYLSLKEKAINVILDSDTYYNHVFGGNVEHKLSKNTSINLSTITSVPINKPEKSYYYTTLYEERHMQSFINLGLTGEIGDIKTNLSLLYATKYYESSLGGIFAPTMWRRAIGVDLEKNIIDNLSGSIKLKASPTFEETIIWPELKYDVNNNIALFGGLQVINAESNESFWYSHRNKDLAYFSVVYSF